MARSTLTWLAPNNLFQPVMETSGEIGPTSLSLLRALGSRLAQQSGEAKFSSGAAGDRYDHPRLCQQFILTDHFIYSKSVSLFIYLFLLNVSSFCLAFIAHLSDNNNNIN